MPLHYYIEYHKFKIWFIKATFSDRFHLHIYSSVGLYTFHFPITHTLLSFCGDGFLVLCIWFLNEFHVIKHPKFWFGIKLTIFSFLFTQAMHDILYHRHHIENVSSSLSLLVLVEQDTLYHDLLLFFFELKDIIFVSNGSFLCCIHNSMTIWSFPGLFLAHLLVSSFFM